MGVIVSELVYQSINLCQHGPEIFGDIEKYFAAGSAVMGIIRVFGDDSFSRDADVVLDDLRSVLQLKFDPFHFELVPIIGECSEKGRKNGQGERS